MKISIPSLLGYAQLLYKQTNKQTTEPPASHYKANRVLRSCTWLEEH